MPLGPYFQQKIGCQVHAENDLSWCRRFLIVAATFVVAWAARLDCPCRVCNSSDCLLIATVRCFCIVVCHWVFRSFLVVITFAIRLDSTIWHDSHLASTLSFGGALSLLIASLCFVESARSLEDCDLLWVETHARVSTRSVSWCVVFDWSKETPIAKLVRSQY